MITVTISRCQSEEFQSFPLPQVRLLLHGHQQGGGPQETAPEAGQHPGCRVREVHPHPVLRHPQLQPCREADPLPLQEVSVRSAGAVPDGSPQVQTYERVTGPSTGETPARLSALNPPAQHSPSVRTTSNTPGWRGNLSVWQSQAEIQFKLHFLTYYLYSDSCPSLMWSLTHSMFFEKAFLLVSLKLSIWSSALPNLSVIHAYMHHQNIFSWIFQENFARCFNDNQYVPEWASSELEPFVATNLICTDIVSRCLKGL